MDASSLKARLWGSGFNVGIRLIFMIALLLPLARCFNNGSRRVDLQQQSIFLEKRATSSYWLANIQRRGRAPFNANSSNYPVFRNVQDYGAKGDGITDDTDAINLAISDGNRCGYGCDSSTTVPALVYFPPGTYMVKAPLIMYYYTQLVGDATSLPTIKAMSNFFGIGVLDSDVYLPYGESWYANQNNFYRQVRNFILDITLMPANRGAGIHWQVAQATSLQNIVFNMRTDKTNNKQQGIFMDNGSGGWMSDLVFNGGGIGAFLGNQQFTTRNLTFNGCQTAVFMNWDWLWTFKSLTVNNCNIGIDLSQGGTVQTVGSLLVTDSVFNNVPQAIITTFSSNSTPVAGGTLVLDNVDFTKSAQAISYPNKTTILAGGSVIQSFLQGRAYTAYESSKQVGDLTCYQPAARSARVQQLAGAPPKPASLLDSTGKIVERSKPQYENYPVSAFVSVKAAGAKGDGVTDDTAIIQNLLNSLRSDQVLYFDHGVYIVTNTIQVPKNVKITGELWPIIMSRGSAFADMNNPKVVWRVANPGDVGTIEMTELVFETQGPAAGAIMMEWNLEGSTPAAAAMWDVHFRIGGTAGTKLQSDTCAKTPKAKTSVDPACIGAYMLMHVTPSGSPYIENNWGWVSDHELDLKDHNQINIYVGRGILIESRKAIWLYGTSYEHCVRYNYQVANAKNVYMAIIQSETAYMQDNPNSLVPFPAVSKYSDPDFHNCFQVTCYKTLALRVYNSTYVLNYGAGLYSFFNNYDSGCLVTESCQEQVIAIDKSEAVYLYGLNTKAIENLVEVDDVSLVPQFPNENSFCQTLAVFEYP